MTEEANQGNVAVSGDEMYPNTEYAYGVANWLPGVPKHSVVSNDVRKTVKENWYYYDGLGYGSVDKGRLTKEINWWEPGQPAYLDLPDQKQRDGGLSVEQGLLRRVRARLQDRNRKRRRQVCHRGHRDRGRERQKSNQYFSGETPRWTAFDYDALSRPVKASYPDGTSTSTSYAGLVVTATDRNGNQKVLTNDAYGRTMGQKDPYGREFRYTYDVVGHLIKWTDPNGNAFAFNYDSLGRQILSDNPVTRQMDLPI